MNNGNQLATREQLASGMDLMTLGKMFAASGFFQDSRDAAQAAVKIQAGAELGFPPVASMTGVYIVKGKVSLSANLIAAAIKRSGKYNYRVKRLDNTGCEIEFIEGAQVIGVSTFNETDARAAQLTNGENYKKFPRNMYFARAISNGAKFYTPDVFGGPVYTPDELGAAVDAETGEVLDHLPPVTVTTQPPPPDGVEPPAAQPDVMGDAEKFAAILDDAFDSGDWDKPSRTRAKAMVCSKYKVKTVSELPPDKRREMLDALVNGRLDKFKVKQDAALAAV